MLLCETRERVHATVVVQIRRRHGAVRHADSTYRIIAARHRNTRYIQFDPVGGIDRAAAFELQKTNFAINMLKRVKQI